MTPLTRPKVLDLPCLFRDQAGRFRVYMGRPAAGFHPLHFQLAWLRESRDGEVEQAVLDHVAGIRPSET